MLCVVETMSADQQEDHTWVIDSLIQFLSGPVWNKPISAFIEKKSTVFEPDCEQDTPEHRIVHREYRNLVDSLLGAFVEELQISPAQFQNAVSSDGSEQPRLARFQPGALLEQVWAASDFATFSSLMGLRNLELQLQALDSLRQHGSSATALLDNDGVSSESASEERLLKHVLRRSMEEASIMERMKKFNRLSLAEPFIKEIDTSILEKVAAAAEEEEQAAAATSKALTYETKEKPNSNSDTRGVIRAPVALTQEEIAKRKAYLCQQRDKLLQAKGRSKPVVIPEPRVSSTEHPEEKKADDPAALQLRRALVNRLKAEVINKN